MSGPGHVVSFRTHKEKWGEGNPIIKCHFQQYFNNNMQGIFFKMLVEKAGKKKHKKIYLCNQCLSPLTL